MNKRKIVLKVEKLGLDTKTITDKAGTIKFAEKIKEGEHLPKVSYWIAFIVLSKQPHITFYKQIYDQDW